MTEKIIQQALLVKTNTSMTKAILQLMAKRGVCAHTTSKAAVISQLEKNTISLIFLDIDPQQPESALKLLTKIRTQYPQLPVIMTIEADAWQSPGKLVLTVNQAIRSGCTDFLTTEDMARLETLVEMYLPKHSVACCTRKANPMRPGDTLYQIIGKSPALWQIVELAKRMAASSAPVLISGESGTGKELIAQMIHYASPRAHGPFIKVNCAALSESLLESEFFGHEKGAFTGASIQRKGRFEAANGGTILLDEITETPLSFQAKLLRVLEMQSFERVGSNDNIDVNVRVVSTSNRNLARAVQEGDFRLDLYYRLNGLRLLIPPLRERPEDLPELIWHFVNLYAPQTQRTIKAIDSHMIELFARYSWPGNVRQLRNAVMTSLVLGTGPILKIADVSWMFDELEPHPQSLLPSNETKSDDSLPQGALAGFCLQDIEKQAILDTLEHTEGNQVRAAKVLGISDRTLRGKIKRYRQEGVLSS